MTLDPSHRWSVRAVHQQGGVDRVYARTNKFEFHGQTDFSTETAAPSALEYLLGSLAADLVAGFAREAERERIDVHSLEARVSGAIGNPLVHLGTIGEEGSVALETLTATLYVGAECDPETVRNVWTRALGRAPVVQTLQRALDIELRLSTVV